MICSCHLSRCAVYTSFSEGTDKVNVITKPSLIQLHKSNSSFRQLTTIRLVTTIGILVTKPSCQAVTLTGCSAQGAGVDDGIHAATELEAMAVTWATTSNPTVTAMPGNRPRPRVAAQPAGVATSPVSNTSMVCRTKEWSRRTLCRKAMPGLPRRLIEHRQR